MPKILKALFLILFCFSLCACQNTQNLPSDISIDDVPEDLKDDYLLLKVHDIDGETVLASAKNGSSYVYSLTFNDIYELSGSQTDISSLSPGTILALSKDQIILETYPPQIKDTDALILGSEKDFLPVYLEAVLDIYEDDSALNDGITMIALDFSNISNITEAEKEALGLLIWENLGVETFQSDYETLVAEGLIDGENLYFPEGVLISIDYKEETEDGFIFDIQKWRSGLGAIFYNDCRVIFDGDSFTVEKGSIAVS